MPEQQAERSILLTDWQGKLTVGLLNLAVWMVGYFSLNKFIEFEAYHKVPTLRIDELLLLPLGSSHCPQSTTTIVARAGP